MSCPEGGGGANRLFDPGENPVMDQLRWSMSFLEFYDGVMRHGKGAGKSWLMARIVRFILKNDPTVRDIVRKEIMKGRW